MKMIKNMGDDDRKYRAVAAIAAVWFGVATGNLQVAMIVAAVLLATAYWRWCPLYQVFDFDTSKKK